MKRTSARLAIAALLLATSCGSSASGGAADAAQVSGSVLVFAAASLADAFAAIAESYEVLHPEAEIQLNVAASSALREQILEGAPADVYASANESNMTQLTDAEMTNAPPQVFANNELQIAVPVGNPGNVAGLADFDRADLLIGLCALDVPCGDLARRALDHAGVVASIDTNEPDVRSLLTKVEAGELDAGIVYTSDIAAAGDAVQGIVIDPSDNQVASYPIAALTDAPNLVGAQSFVAYVLSAEGQAILASYGFASP